MAIASAALVPDAPEMLPTDSFGTVISQHVAHQLRSIPMRTAIGVTIGRERPAAALESAARSGVGSVIGASLAHRLGKLYSDREVGYLAHKLGHFAAGGLSGAVMSRDPALGAFSGAIGACTAEVMMEAICDLQAEAKSVMKANPDMTPSELVRTVADNVRGRKYLSQFTGALAAGLAGGDVDIAASTGLTALENNFLGVALRATLASLAIKGVIDAQLELDRLQREEGFVAALVKGSPQFILATFGAASQGATQIVTMGSQVAVYYGNKILLFSRPLITKMLQTLRTSSVAKALRVEKVLMPRGYNVIRGVDGKIAGVEGFQLHHLVSNKHYLTANHELWKLAGVNINSGANTMLLPTLRGAAITTTKRSIHQGRHFNAVSERLATKMQEVVDMGPISGFTQARYREELTRILYSERVALMSGIRRLNKHAQPWAEVFK